MLEPPGDLPVFAVAATGCLVARRLVERGVRYVHLEHGRWDDHDKIDEFQKLINSNRGGNRLFLEIEGADGQRRRVRADERHSVQISAPLAQGLEELLGKGRARLARV